MQLRYLSKNMWNCYLCSETLHYIGIPLSNFSIRGMICDHKSDENIHLDDLKVHVNVLFSNVTTHLPFSCRSNL